MKLLMGFILGVIVATTGTLLAQSGGMYFDQHGKPGSYWQTAPNGPINYQDSTGKMGTVYQQPSFGKSPC